MLHVSRSLANNCAPVINGLIDALVRFTCISLFDYFVSAQVAYGHILLCILVNFIVIALPIRLRLVNPSLLEVGLPASLKKEVKARAREPRLLEVEVRSDFLLPHTSPLLLLPSAHLLLNRPVSLERPNTSQLWSSPSSSSKRT